MGRNTDEIKRLYERLHELDKQSEKNKGIRHTLSTLLFVAMRFILLYAIVEPHGVEAFLCCLLVSVLWGAFAHWLYFYLFMYHFVKSEEENSVIRYIKSEISRLEKMKDDDEQ